MANWAYTDYVIEGPEETLEKINEAILYHPVEEGSSRDWEGNVLKALDIEWEPHKIEQEGDTVKFFGYYMRGFIQQDSLSFDNNVLRFSAEEAWGATDFAEVLENNIPGIKVFYEVEEEGEGIYATNDKEGKYFKDRYYVDTCIDGNYESEYFITEKDMYKWISKITHSEVGTPEEVDDFNTAHEEDDSDADNYICIHKFDVID